MSGDKRFTLEELSRMTLEEFADAMAPYEPKDGAFAAGPPVTEDPMSKDDAEAPEGALDDPEMDDVTWLLTFRRWWTTTEPARRHAMIEMAWARLREMEGGDEMVRRLLDAEWQSAWDEMTPEERAAAAARDRAYVTAIQRGDAGDKIVELVEELALTEELLFKGWTRGEYSLYMRLGERRASIFIDGVYSVDVWTGPHHPGPRDQFVCGQVSHPEWAILIGEDSFWQYPPAGQEPGGPT